jgi:hypothetical protein
MLASMDAFESFASRFGDILSSFISNQRESEAEIEMKILLDAVFLIRATSLSVGFLLLKASDLYESTSKVRRKKKNKTKISKGKRKKFLFLFLSLEWNSCIFIIGS